jgi:hypothetical protein
VRVWQRGTKLPSRAVDEADFGGSSEDYILDQTLITSKPSHVACGVPIEWCCSIEETVINLIGRTLIPERK